jgi:hypothetical protein
MSRAEDGFRRVFGGFGGLFLGFAWDILGFPWVRQKKTMLLILLHLMASYPIFQFFRAEA